MASDRDPIGDPTPVLMILRARFRWLQAKEPYTQPPETPYDRWHQLVALGEPLVVFQELPNAFLGRVSYTNTDGRPRAVVAILYEALQDPPMDVDGIRSCSEPIVEPSQDQVRIELFWLGQHILIGQDLLNSLGQLLALSRVCATHGPTQSRDGTTTL